MNQQLVTIASSGACGREQPTSLRHKDCSTFWEFICKHWNSETQQLLSGCITKVPAHYEGKIMLVEKQDVFIPDDLLLEDLFDKQAKQPLFVWYPSAGTTFLSRTKLNDIYSSIGVKKISKVVLKEECKSITLDSVTTTPTGTVIKPGLLRIVLAFLANPTIGISAEKRHQMVSSLTSVALKGLSRPFDINYRVTLSSGRTIVVKSAGKFRWERENSRLFLPKYNGSLSSTERIEYAIGLAEEISKGLLFEKTDQVSALAELLKIFVRL